MLISERNGLNSFPLKPSLDASYWRIFVNPINLHQNLRLFQNRAPAAHFSKIFEFKNRYTNEKYYVNHSYLYLIMIQTN